VLNNTSNEVTIQKKISIFIFLGAEMQFGQLKKTYHQIKQYFQESSLLAATEISSFGTFL